MFSHGSLHPLEKRMQIKLQAHRENFKESTESKHNLRNFIYKSKRVQKVGSEANLHTGFARNFKIHMLYYN